MSHSKVPSNSISLSSYFREIIQPVEASSASIETLFKSSAFGTCLTQLGRLTSVIESEISINLKQLSINNSPVLSFVESIDNSLKVLRRSLSFLYSITSIGNDKNYLLFKGSLEIFGSTLGAIDCTIRIFFSTEALTVSQKQFQSIVIRIFDRCSKELPSTNQANNNTVGNHDFDPKILKLQKFEHDALSEVILDAEFSCKYAERESKVPDSPSGIMSVEKAESALLSSRSSELLQPILSDSDSSDVSENSSRNYELVSPIIEVSNDRKKPSKLSKVISAASNGAPLLSPESNESSEPLASGFDSSDGSENSRRIDGTLRPVIKVSNNRRKPSNSSKVISTASNGALLLSPESNESSELLASGFDSSDGSENSRRIDGTLRPVIKVSNNRRKPSNSSKVISTASNGALLLSPESNESSEPLASGFDSSDGSENSRRIDGTLRPVIKVSNNRRKPSNSSKVISTASNGALLLSPESNESSELLASGFDSSDGSENSRRIDGTLRPVIKVSNNRRKPSNLSKVISTASNGALLLSPESNESSEPLASGFDSSDGSENSRRIDGTLRPVIKVSNNRRKHSNLSKVISTASNSALLLSPESNESSEPLASGLNSSDGSENSRRIDGTLRPVIKVSNNRRKPSNSSKVISTASNGALLLSPESNESSELLASGFDSSDGSENSRRIDGTLRPVIKVSNNRRKPSNSSKVISPASNGALLLSPESNESSEPLASGFDSSDGSENSRRIDGTLRPVIKVSNNRRKPSNSSKVISTASNGALLLSPESNESSELLASGFDSSDGSENSRRINGTLRPVIKVSNNRRKPSNSSKVISAPSDNAGILSSDSCDSESSDESENSSRNNDSYDSESSDESENSSRNNDSYDSESSDESENSSRNNGIMSPVAEVSSNTINLTNNVCVPLAYSEIVPFTDTKQKKRFDELCLKFSNQMKFFWVRNGSKLKFTCLLCADTVCCRNVEKHVQSPHHSLNVNKRRDGSSHSQILSDKQCLLTKENQKFLDYYPVVEALVCTLCNLLLVPVNDKWFEHFLSDSHSSKLRDSQVDAGNEQDRVSKIPSNEGIGTDISKDKSEPIVEKSNKLKNVLKPMNGKTVDRVFEVSSNTNLVSIPRFLPISFEENFSFSNQEHKKKFDDLCHKLKDQINCFSVKKGKQLWLNCLLCQSQWHCDNIEKHALDTSHLLKYAELQNSISVVKNLFEKERFMTEKNPEFLTHNATPLVKILFQKHSLLSEENRIYFKYFPVSGNHVCILCNLLLIAVKDKWVLHFQSDYHLVQLQTCKTITDKNLNECGERKLEDNEMNDYSEEMNDFSSVSKVSSTHSFLSSSKEVAFEASSDSKPVTNLASTLILDESNSNSDVQKQIYDEVDSKVGQSNVSEIPSNKISISDGLSKEAKQSLESSILSESKSSTNFEKLEMSRNGKIVNLVSEASHDTKSVTISGFVPISKERLFLFSSQEQRKQFHDLCHKLQDEINVFSINKGKKLSLTCMLCCDEWDYNNVVQHTHDKNHRMKLAMHSSSKLVVKNLFNDRCRMKKGNSTFRPQNASFFVKTLFEKQSRLNEESREFLDYFHNSNSFVCTLCNRLLISGCNRWIKHFVRDYHLTKLQNLKSDSEKNNGKHDDKKQDLASELKPLEAKRIDDRLISDDDPSQSRLVKVSASSKCLDDDVSLTCYSEKQVPICKVIDDGRVVTKISQVPISCEKNFQFSTPCQENQFNDLFSKIPNQINFFSVEMGKKLKLKCLLCDQMLRSTEVEKHVLSPSHSIRVEKKRKFNSTNKILKERQALLSEKDRKFLDYFLGSQVFVCTLCKLILLKERGYWVKHFQSDYHISKYQSLPTDFSVVIQDCADLIVEQIDEIRTDSTIPDSSSTERFNLQNLKFSRYLHGTQFVRLVQRINEQINQFSFESSPLSKNLKFVCEYCDESFVTVDSAAGHLKKRKHLQNLEADDSEIIILPAIKECTWKFLKPCLKTEKFICTHCKASLPCELDSWINHFQSESHSVKSEKLKAIDIIPKSCDIDKSQYDLISHSENNHNSSSLNLNPLRSSEERPSPACDLTSKEKDVFKSTVNSKQIMEKEENLIQYSSYLRTLCCGDTGTLPVAPINTDLKKASDENISNVGLIHTDLNSALIHTAFNEAPVNSEINTASVLIDSNSAPIQTNSAPIQTNSAPIKTNSAPIQTNSALIHTTLNASPILKCISESAPKWNSFEDLFFLKFAPKITSAEKNIYEKSLKNVDLNHLDLFLVDFSESKSKKPHLLCKVCDKAIPVTKVTDHIKTSKHWINVTKPLISEESRKYLVCNKKSQYSCNLCRVTLSMSCLLTKHFQSESHNLKLQSLKATEKETESTESLDNFEGSESDGDNYLDRSVAPFISFGTSAPSLIPVDECKSSKTETTVYPVKSEDSASFNYYQNEILTRDNSPLSNYRSIQFATHSDGRKFLKIVKQLRNQINVFSIRSFTLINHERERVVQLDCLLCDKSFKDCGKAFNHITQQEHLLRLANNSSRTPIKPYMPSLSEEHWNYFVPSINRQCYVCTVCELEVMNDFTLWIEHFQSEGHILKLQDLRNVLLKLERCRLSKCSTVSKNKSAKSSFEPDSCNFYKQPSNPFQQLQAAKSTEIPMPLNLFQDSFDSVALKAASSAHQRQFADLTNEINYQINYFSVDNKARSKELTLICRLCDKSMLATEVIDHTEEQEHLLNLVSKCGNKSSVPSASYMSEEDWGYLDFDDTIQEYLCTLCNVKLSSCKDSWAQHFLSDVHFLKLKESQFFKDCEQRGNPSINPFCSSKKFTKVDGGEKELKKFVSEDLTSCPDGSKSIFSVTGSINMQEIPVKNQISDYKLGVSLVSKFEELFENGGTDEAANLESKLVHFEEANFKFSEICEDVQKSIDKRCNSLDRCDEVFLHLKSPESYSTIELKDIFYHYDLFKFFELEDYFISFPKLYRSQQNALKNNVRYALFFEDTRDLFCSVCHCYLSGKDEKSLLSIAAEHFKSWRHVSESRRRGRSVLLKFNLVTVTFFKDANAYCNICNCYLKQCVPEKIEILLDHFQSKKHYDLTHEKFEMGEFWAASKFLTVLLSVKKRKLKEDNLFNFSGTIKE